MRLDRGLLVCALACSSAVGVHADSIPATDPTIIIGRSAALSRTATTTCSSEISVRSLSFSVPVDAKTGGNLCSFDNTSGRNWTGLIFTVTFESAQEAKAAKISCSPISMCTPQPPSQRQGATVTITLKDFNISNGSGFFINLNDPNSTMGHWEGDKIQVQAMTMPDTTPESAMLLIVAGTLGGGIWLRRKWGCQTDS